MIVSGFTEDRLNDIKTYSEANPYQVGVNGVTNISYNNNGDITSIDYSIDGITYKTFFPQSLNRNFSRINVGTPFERYGKQGLNSTTRTRGFTPIPVNRRDETNNRDVLYPTIFYYTPGGCDVEEYNVIKEEVKIGVVFPPKIEEEIFIERMSISVFEPHSRMRDISSLDQLEDYRNGYYNIVNLQ